MAAKESKKPVMDVEKPGTTPAPATSRPVIIGKGPAIKDPMVNETKSEEDSKHQPLPPAKKKTIQPITDDVSKEEEPKQTEPSQAEPVANPDSNNELPSTGDTDQAEESTPEPKTSEEEIKRQELVYKLINNKKYYVPIGAVQKKRAARSTIVLLILLVVVAAGAVLAIDADLIQTDITLPFDLIK